MKFLRIIRFDRSDEHVFECAAEEAEWAVSGAFEFAASGEDEFAGKTKQAFANGFLGLASFGRSTFSVVSEMTESELAEAQRALTEHFMERYGAPGEEEAGAAAREELNFVLELCEGKPANTVFTVQRVMEKGNIREAFREVKASESDHARIWDIVSDDA